MRNLILIIFCGLCAGLLTFTGRAQDSTNAADTLKQSVADLQKNPGDDALLEKIIKLAATMKPKPETPDEANRHFVKAATFLKEAKDKSDYQLAVDEYRQALLLAPWWGAAYFNEGVALQSAGQFDQATAAFKLYLLTNPDDAADVKTRIYSMEAEKELAAKHAADEQAKAQQEAAKAQPVKTEESLKQKLSGIYRISAGASWQSAAEVERAYRCIHYTFDVRGNRISMTQCFDGTCYSGCPDGYTRGFIEGTLNGTTAFSDNGQRLEFSADFSSVDWFERNGTLGIVRWGTYKRVDDPSLISPKFK